MSLPRLFCSRRARLAFNVSSVAVALGVGALMARHFVRNGWPLAHANVVGVLGASALFLAAYAFKAWGWQRLFRHGARPNALALAAAGGAASVTGLALPGRCDDVVRVAVVRRYPGHRCGIGAVCLSLFVLGLVEAAAMAPFASVAAGISVQSNWLRAGLAVVAAGGILAAVLVAAAPWLARTKRVLRYRGGRWLNDHTTSPRDAAKAWVFVVVSWTLRGAALLILLDALALHTSVPLALGFLCATAAAAALPIAPGGAVAQLGAGAGFLVMAGTRTADAVAFSVAVQTLIVLAGAVVVLVAAAAPLAQRLRVPSLRY
jgi:uncharacterized membrane protein YbhN (UPF0104 family)